jgi:hypothetical protein
VLCNSVHRNDLDTKDGDRILHTQVLPALKHPNIQAYRVCQTSDDLCLSKPQLAVNDTTSEQHSPTTTAQLLNCVPFEVRGLYIPKLRI